MNLGSLGPEALRDEVVIVTGAGRGIGFETARALMSMGAALAAKVARTYREQSEGWKKRNLFERQWVLRDFKRQTGMSADGMGSVLAELEAEARRRSDLSRFRGPLERLASYYAHQQKLLQGFEKDPELVSRNLAILDGWIGDISHLLERGLT